jgi:two-component system cell cycle sensor histidine kinase/response regulator CckA
MPVSQPVHPEHGSSLAELPVPILCMTPEGIILRANQMARALLGDLNLNETNIDQILQGLNHPILEWLAQTASGEEVARSEFQRLTRDDKELFVQVTLDRVQIDGKSHLIAVLNDATELKTLEAQFVQGQKMQAVGQLAGGVAHDFNNLLTAISGHCDLLLLRHDQNDPNYGDLVQINQNANRAAALVSQLLAFSRKQTLRPEVLDVRDTISDLIHLLNRLVGEKVQLTLSHDPVLKPVRADKRQLEQVLMNLVVNARDAMPDGGEIRIETEVLSLTEPLRRDRATVPPGDYMTVKVIDSGIGIPADKLQKVFEPFYTTKRTGEGTGLGLSTVYGIVKQTGGFIFVDSVVGRGTEFSLLLPVCVEAKPAEVQTEDVPDSKTARQGEGVVLRVEDEAPVRAFATRALRLKGYTVLEAESAEDALTLLEDVKLNVDVFVTDVVMPGMDGPTWVAKAMETRPDVRVVFVSGYTEGAFGDSGPQVPNSTFLPKPFSLTQLTEAVFQQMN